MTQLNHVRQAVAAALFLGLSALGQAQTLVGQTNQDIDLFLNNPAIPANRPNVLIVWDNTANWGQQVNGRSMARPLTASRRPRSRAWCRD